MVLFLVQRSYAIDFLLINNFNPDFALPFKNAVSPGLEVFGVSVSVGIEGFSSHYSLTLPRRVVKYRFRYNDASHLTTNFRSSKFTAFSPK